MQIGVMTFPTNYSIHPTALGRALETRGFDSVWVVEHTHIPASRKTPYPVGGDLPSIYWEAYEPFTYLAQVAAVTQRLQIGTGICLVPEHHPITLAKRIASLDSLSNGRFLFGVGAGWNREELENHGIRYEDRWAVLRECVLAMKAMWTQKDAEYHGKFVDFDPVWVEPKPARKPHPPVFIGAQSKWAIRRVVEYGDGWFPIAVPNFAEQVQQLEDECKKAGRNRAEIDVTAISMVADKAALAQLAKLGVNRVLLSLPTVNEADSLRWMDDNAKVVTWAQQMGA
ncbi:MAG: LLM class F420-dependent oxidoreductase [Proteobacteria bacterium]|nr:LLM class F420-dependent oxidoreductase [Pseudomonadota bacterium]